MTQRLPTQKVKEIERLRYKEHLSVAEISRRIGASYTAVYGYTRVREMGFKSFNEYFEDRLKKRGYKSRVDYRHKWLENKGLTGSEYESSLVPKRGFASLQEYIENLPSHKKKLRMSKNRRLRRILRRTIKKGLAGIGKNQAWLANSTMIPHSLVSEYATGKYLPSKERAERIFQALGLPYKKLEEILVS